ncbi:MAG: glycoside hydrolase family 3 N-terminal domain-containing protein [Bacteroidota bacterium]
MRNFRLIGIIGLLLGTISAVGQSSKKEAWVDSVFNTMSLDQKIGQLFVVATFSNKDEAEYSKMEKLVRQQHLGGLIFMQGNPKSQVQLINRYQRAAKVPLLISQDAEWGLAMRLKGVPRYPKNMTLGAIQNDSLIYRMGREMGKDLRRVGVNWNFAPSVDINNNPKNPVINFRSFGEDKYNVARKGVMIMKGMQGVGVMAAAKHFPGHGDTDTDSHYSLPLINHDQVRLDSLELYPFMKMTRAGVASVMVGHLHIPALDTIKNRPTSLSPSVVNGLLRSKMNYDGLIVTDALNMKGVTKSVKPGHVALNAFKAGNDVLLFPSNIPLSIKTMKIALQQGEIAEGALNERVKRVLRAKYDCSLHTFKPINPDGISSYIYRKEAQILRKQLYESAITLAKNDKILIPLKDLEKRKIALVQIGGSKNSTLFRTLSKYDKVTPINLPNNFTPQQQAQALKKLESFNTVIIGVFGMKRSAKDNFGITLGTKMISEKLSGLGKDVILTLFGSPYALNQFGTEKAILVAYEGVKEAQEAAAKAIFGGMVVNGRLPVTAGPKFKAGTGRLILKPTRFGFSYPEEEGMDSQRLQEIDGLVKYYIQKKAMPGAAVLVLKGNNIVYEKGFGSTQYGDKGRKIHPYLHTYDLASVTKVAATTVGSMFLYEKGMLDLDKPLQTYLPELKGTNKSRLTVRRLMQHNAGLAGWLSVYQQTYADTKRKRLDKKYYSYYPSRSHNTQIAPALYGSHELDKLFIQTLKESPVNRTTRVKYSDVGLIVTGMTVEKIARRPLDEYMDYVFYNRLGMNKTSFNPHSQKKEKYCPPTEADVSWRQAVIKGYVHDPNSAIMGGVAGHAGLFSNVYDLTKLMLMLKNGGTYGGDRFLKEETIKYFTRQQLSYSRRGLGWDKPARKGEKSSPCSKYASRTTFGHTGFTGTAVWVDPAYDLVFVFLSNRTYPDQSNRLLYRENVRSKIHDKVYQSIFTYNQKKKARLVK